MAVDSSLSSTTRLFRDIKQCFEQSAIMAEALEKACNIVGFSFDLDRAVAMLFDADSEQLEIVAEYCRAPFLPLADRCYQLRANSELYRALSEGRPIALMEILLGSGESRVAPELTRFIKDSQSQSLMVFPIIGRDGLKGCLWMHFCRAALPFSEELLEAGQALADELSLGLNQAALQSTSEKLVFQTAALPLMVVDRETLRLVQANRACARLLNRTPAAEELTSLFQAADRARLRDAIDQLKQHPLLNVAGLVVDDVLGGPLIVNVHLAMASANLCLLALLPDCSQAEATGKISGRREVAELEALLASTSTQLYRERAIRHGISRLHLSLDRHIVLQTACDFLGRALSASRCLIICTEGTTEPAATHEWMEADLSPLGLSLTAHFPLESVLSFQHRTVAINLDRLDQKPSDICHETYEYMQENLVRSLIATPIVYLSSVWAVIVVESIRPHHWSAYDLEMIECVARELSTALNHAQTCAQMKEQLFNMSLITNLTQQLTNTLEMALGANLSGKRPESSYAASTPALSNRELEVLKLIASGLSNREIAQKLFLTESTVELHASRVRKKLKLKSRTALVKFACDHQLV